MTTKAAKLPSAGTSWLLVVLVALFLLRIAVAAMQPVTSTEAYLWLLGLRWEAANFSGPGGLPLLAILLDPPGPDGTWILARLVSPISAAFATAGAWWLTRILIPEKNSLAPWLAAAAWNLLPAVNPATLKFDSAMPFAAAWIWFAALSVRAIQSSKIHTKPGTSPLLWWALAALAGTLAAWISYAFWLVPAALLLFAVTRPGPCLRQPGFYLAFALLALAWAPIFLWNSKSEWIAFAGTTATRLLSFGWQYSLDVAISLLRGAGIMSAPILLAAAAWSAVRASRSDTARCVVPLLVPAALAIVFTLWNGVETALPLWLPLSLVALPWILREISMESLRTSNAPRLLALALLLTGMQSALLPLTAGVLLSFEAPWSDLSARLRRAAFIHQAAGKSSLFFIAPDAQTAAALSYHLLQDPDHEALVSGFPPVFVHESQFLSDQFGLWPRYDEFFETPQPQPGEMFTEQFTEQQGINPYIGRSALYLSTESPEDLPQTIRSGFSRILPLEEIFTSQGIWFLYLCEDYQGAPL
jgi:hypothetical protein